METLLIKVAEACKLAATDARKDGRISPRTEGAITEAMDAITKAFPAQLEEEQNG